MDAVLDGIQAFGDRLSEVEFRPLAIAIALHLLKTVCTSRAWFNTLRASYPEPRFRWRSIYGAYIAGVGFNAVMPIRGGDVVKLGLAHRAIQGATYTTLAATFLVLAIVDSIMGLVFFVYALTQHVLPSLGALPDLPSFDYGWFFHHGRASTVLVVVLALLAALAAVWIHRRVREFWARVRQGFAVLRNKRRYLGGVAFWQVCDWGLRLLAISFFLRAFGIEPSARNVLLVQVTQSLATLVPVSPAGIGTEQAFIVYVFRGTVSGSKLLAFSVGMKLTLVLTNVIVGFTALALTLRTLKVGDWLKRRKPASDEPAADAAP